MRWRDVPGFPGYMVSDLGAIKSVPKYGKRGVMLRTNVCPRGYHRVPLTNARGKRRLVPLHRIVLLAFRGPAPEQMVGCHNNGIPADNRLSNLRWGSLKSNHADSVRHGTSVGSQLKVLKAQNAALKKRVMKLLAENAWARRKAGKSAALAKAQASA